MLSPAPGTVPSRLAAQTTRRQGRCRTAHQNTDTGLTQAGGARLSERPALVHRHLLRGRLWVLPALLQQDPMEGAGSQSAKDSATSPTIAILVDCPHRSVHSRAGLGPAGCGARIPKSDPSQLMPVQLLAPRTSIASTTKSDDSAYLHDVFARHLGKLPASLLCTLTFVFFVN